MSYLIISQSGSGGLKNNRYKFIFESRTADGCLNPSFFSHEKQGWAQSMCAYKQILLLFLVLQSGLRYSRLRQTGKFHPWPVHSLHTDRRMAWRNLGRQHILALALVLGRRTLQSGLGLLLFQQYHRLGRSSNQKKSQGNHISWLIHMPLHQMLPEGLAALLHH